MSKTAFIEKMLDSGAIVKLSHCFENNGPSDIPSCLYYSNGHGHAVTPMTEDVDPLLWLMEAMTTAYDQHGPFIELGFIGDAFGREFENKEDLLKSIEESDQTLEEQHKTDPSLPVKEILVAYAIFGDGSEASGITEYSYGDDGMPVFSQPLVTEGSHAGAIPFVLNSFYNFLKTFPKEG